MEIQEKFFKALDVNFQHILDGSTDTMKHSKEYAAMFFLHPNYFSNLIKEKTGRSACEWIELRTVEEAKYLLKTTNNSIAEIAYKLTYNDASNFTKFFKKFTNMTPGEYRKSFSKS